MLGMIDRDPNVDGHVMQVLDGGGGVVEDDVDGCTHHRQRRAQFVGGIGDEPPLAVESALEPVEHLVEGLGQLLELVARPA